MGMVSDRGRAELDLFNLSVPLSLSTASVTMGEDKSPQPSGVWVGLNLGSDPMAMKLVCMCQFKLMKIR